MLHNKIIFFTSCFAKHQKSIKLSIQCHTNDVKHKTNALLISLNVDHVHSMLVDMRDLGIEPGQGQPSTNRTTPVVRNRTIQVKPFPSSDQIQPFFAQNSVSPSFWPSVQALGHLKIKQKNTNIIQNLKTIQEEEAVVLRRNTLVQNIKSQNETQKYAFG